MMWIDHSREWKMYTEMLCSMYGMDRWNWIQSLTQWDTLTQQNIPKCSLVCKRNAEDFRPNIYPIRLNATSHWAEHTIPWIQCNILCTFINVDVAHLPSQLLGMQQFNAHPQTIHRETTGRHSYTYEHMHRSNSWAIFAMACSTPMQERNYTK